MMGGQVLDSTKYIPDDLHIDLCIESIKDSNSSLYNESIRYLNRLNIPVLSLGYAFNESITFNTRWTLCFILPGIEVWDQKKYTGELYLCDLGIGKRIYDSLGIVFDGDGLFYGDKYSIGFESNYN